MTVGRNIPPTPPDAFAQHAETPLGLLPLGAPAPPLHHRPSHPLRRKPEPMYAHQGRRILLRNAPPFVCMVPAEGLEAQLADEAVGLAPAVDEVEHEAYVHADAALQVGVEGDVARHGLPVAVEGQSDELALAVEHG